VQFKRSDMRIFDDAFNMHGGYVLDFSDRTFAEFFEDEFGIEIYQDKYRFNGSSKAKRQCHGNSDSSAVRRRLASSDETDIV
jgi:hypothetical protein